MTFFLDVPIKLIGGEREEERNVSVDGEPVCDDGWNNTTSKVASRQLGFTGVHQITLGEYGNYFKNGIS